VSVTSELDVTPIVEMRGITKTFGSTRALRGVDLTVRPGEVHALLGRNGAGKSTLVSALSGVTPSDSGVIRVGDISIDTHGQDYAEQLRSVIAHVHQTPQLFNFLTVAENLFVNNRNIERAFGFLSHRAMTKEAKAMINTWGINLDPSALVGSLSAESRQLLEIMKALGRGVPVIILDEPTAALSNAEKRTLYESVKDFKSQGVAFIYISHHLEEVFEIADVVTILRDGELVREREPVMNLDIQTIANLMVGEEAVRSSRTDSTDAHAVPLIEARSVRISTKSQEAVDFAVRPGEIVALAGPVGSGKEDLAMIVAGQAKPAGGEVVSPSGQELIVGYVPSDRHVSGYVRILSVKDNVAVGGLDVLSNSAGFINQRNEFTHVDRLCRETNVLASSWDMLAGQLSGGNQQKVVFARALCRAPNVIVALSPTRGVDVGAKEQLYALLRELATQGMAVIVVSDEHEEIDQLANRVLIVVDNKIAATLSGDYEMEDLVLKMEGVA